MHNEENNKKYAFSHTKLANYLHFRVKYGIIKIYQAKDNTNEAAYQITEYPTNDSKVPVGMTEEEFAELFQ